LTINTKNNQNYLSKNQWRFGNSCCLFRTEDSLLGVATVVATDSSKSS